MASFRKKGDSWYYSFDLATVNGKRRRIERKGGKTKREAQAAARKAQMEYENSGQLFTESSLSVSDYLDYWYENYVIINLRGNTQKWYRNIIDKHLKPQIGQYRLNQLKPATLQEFLNNKSNYGFSKSTLSSFQGVLCKSLQMAVHPYNYIKYNPMQYVSLPKMETTHTSDKHKIISSSDFKRIIERFPEGSTFHLPVQISYTTGLRAAEVCGLTWDNIDLQNKTLTVSKILNYKTRGIYEYGPPKTKSSERTITLSDSLVLLLKRTRIWQKENILKYGEYYTHNNHVCTKENGEYVTTGSFRYLSRIINYELKIPFNFHSLRHAHVSLLMEAGVNIKAIQERLGHAKIETTMNTYAHLTPELEEQSVSILNQVYSI